MKVLLFSGSARQGNYTQYVAEFVRQIAAKNPEWEVEVVSPKSLGLNFENEGTSANYPELRAKVAAADAFIVVSPEYNHAFSGSVKFMLDLNLKEYIHKPAMIVGVSMGSFGGARMIEALIGVFRELGLVATFTDVNVTDVQKEIVDGKFLEPDKWERRVNRAVDELLWMAKTLKYGRDNFPEKKAAV